MHTYSYYFSLSMSHCLGEPGVWGSGAENAGLATDHGDPVTPPPPSGLTPPPKPTPAMIGLEVGKPFQN